MAALSSSWFARSAIMRKSIPEEANDSSLFCSLAPSLCQLLLLPNRSDTLPTSLQNIIWSRCSRSKYKVRVGSCIREARVRAFSYLGQPALICTDRKFKDVRSSGHPYIAISVRITGMLDRDALLLPGPSCPLL